MTTQADRNAYIAYHNDLAEPFIRRQKQLFAQAQERRAKAKQQEPQELKSITEKIQAAKEKLQQQLLTVADLKAQIAVFQNADNAIANNTDTTNTTNVSIKNTNTHTLGADEHYKTTIVTKMVALIKQRKMK